MKVKSINHITLSCAANVLTNRLYISRFKHILSVSHSHTHDGGDVWREVSSTRHVVKMSPCCYLGLAFSVSFLSQGFLGLSRTSLSLSVPPEFCCLKLDTVDLIETGVRVKTQTWSIQDSIKLRLCLSCIEVRYRSKEWVSKKLFFF